MVAQLNRPGLVVMPSPEASERSSLERRGSGQLVKPASDGRWYNRDAIPILRVNYADRKRAGETRPPTLADARKLGLYPSESLVRSMLARPALQAWQATQYIMAALTLPRLEGESLDEFAVRVVEDGEAYRNQAAAAGQDLHAAIADYMAGRDAFSYRGDWSAHLRAFAGWWEASGLRCLAAEHRFVNHEFGYGGMVDCLATDVDDPQDLEDLIVIDWKTQETEPGQPVRWYDDWAIQLASYGQRGPRMLSVVVSRSEPGRVEMGPPPRRSERSLGPGWHERDRWWAVFHAALCLWKLRSDYYPGAA